MSSSILLNIGEHYKGEVVDVRNAYDKFGTGLNKSIIMYGHIVVIKFDLYPDTPLTCQWCDTDPQSKAFKKGDYVKVHVRTFSKNMHTVSRTNDFVESPVRESTSIYYPESTPQSQQSAFCPDEIRAAFIQTAIRGAATFCQYRPDMGIKDLFELIDDMYTSQLLKFENTK